MKLEDAPLGQIASETVVSVGIGARWNWTDKFSLSLDYAHEVNDVRASEVGGDKVHVNVFYRF